MKFKMYILLVLFFSSCDLILKKEEKPKSDTRVIKEFYDTGSLKTETSVKGNERHGPTKNYDRKGNLTSETPYVNNKKEGLHKDYYPSGKIHLTINFKNGVKEGDETWYYENEKPFRVNPFVNGKIHGIQKWYYKNGRLMGEVPYKEGFAGIGLKEYTEEGQLITSYPEIIFKEVNQIMIADKFVLKISMSNNARKVKFYLDDLNEGKYTKKYMFELPVENGVASQNYHVPPGFMKMEKINVIAVYTTPRGLPYITQKIYNLALQH
jgi:antitoxin component YwqK of YwqJK toxin-antitoxin module